MTLRELVAQTSGDLRGCGIESYVRDARALCAFALGIQPDQVSINANGRNRASARGTFVAHQEAVRKNAYFTNNRQAFILGAYI